MKNYIIIVCCFLLGCTDSVESDLDNHLEQENYNSIRIIINPEGLQVSDSSFIELFMKGDNHKIINGNYRIDSDLKTGIYSIALLENGNYQQALSSIPNYKCLKFEWDDGEKIYSRRPSTYERCMGFYELYAFYRYAIHIDNIEPEIKSILLMDMESSDFVNNLFTDIEFLLNTTTQKEYEYYSKRGGNFNVDSLILVYPKWQRLKIVKAHYYYVSDNFDLYRTELKNIYNNGYFPREVLKKLIDEYIFGKEPNLDSASGYIALFKNDCDVSVNEYYLKRANYNEMEKSCQNCIIDSLLWRDAIITKLQLSKAYLKQKKFDKVKEMIDDFKINNNGYIRTELREWLREQYFILEIEFYFAKGEYSNIERLMDSGFGEVPSPLPSNERILIIKELSNKYLKLNTTMFNEFYLKNFE